jgi:hypothetical protein
MADGHCDRMSTLSQLLREVTPANINSTCVNNGPHSYSLLGFVMYTLYLSFEFDIHHILQMLKQCLQMRADPNVLMYVEQAGSDFYTVHEFALMLSRLRLYPTYIMDDILKEFTAAGGRVQNNSVKVLTQIETGYRSRC